MPFDKLKYPDALLEARRKRVEDSLRPISVAEMLATLREHQEEFVENPSRDEFIRLIQEQPQATFYHAIAQDDVIIYYCRDADFGVWIIPGTGIGPLDVTAKRVIKQAIANPKHS